ncbi:MAG: diguanylate cyclase [Gomphosphaeria aponina SAG 52.96 = DSM 107014]|uniref:Diguanylate cyclase n=1 Tax=Gomphosphaeria aponina SAG 52.96 = DSM 107014 TaxID=1521640 RepID=A0A941JVE4_9CHRO|nr:diguanylate cyclase [Gomphosphaeria aponina SAG 52.96 = DSM 107014]
MNKSNLEQNSPLILVVDDDRTLRMVMRLAMENEGYRVVERSNGKEGLAACCDLRPDMVLIDGMMPEMDGFTCCRELINILGHECPPILMITVLDDQESVDRAFAAGATDYLTKPIHLPVLRQRVKRMLATEKELAQLKQQKKELERFVTIDSVTGLPNRRGFEEYLHREWLRGLEAQTPLSLIISNVNNFQEYQAQYGIKAGDEYLKQIANIFRENCHSFADFVARYEEEKFAMILPNTSEDSAVLVAKNIQNQVKNQVISLSLGGATVIPNSQLAQEIFLEKVSAALFQAQGNNNLVFAN